jgi:RND family efflux transporter MFP subunit
MYKEVPFIGVLEPLIQKKQKFMAMEKGRRAVRIAVGLAALVFLVAFPLPMRLGGNATVAPARTAKIQPEVEGVVKTVLVRESQPVARGQVIAELESWDYSGALAAAEAKRAAAVAEMNRALATNDSSAAGVKRVEAEYWTAETARARERLQRTRLTSPIDGVIATPHIENLVGTHLTTDDVFAEIVDTRQAMVDVGIEESEVALLRAGASSAVKLESYPTRTFRGQVEIVSPSSTTAGDHRLFFARVKVANPEGVIRPGMQGNAKVSVGWRPAGYVLFRGLGRWFWGKLWNWFGW